MRIKIIVLAATLLIPVVLLLLTSISNRKKEERYKQIVMPLVALIFSTACCLLFSWLSRLIDLLLNLSFMSGVKQWIQTGCGLTYGLRLYSAYLLNIGILIAYLLFKNSYRLVFAVFKKIIGFFIHLFRKANKEDDEEEKKNKTDWREEMPEDLDELTGVQKLYWRFLNLFYDIDDRTGTVRSRWLAVGHVFLYATRAVVVLFLAFLLFAQLPLFSGAVFFPYGLMNACIDHSYLWPAISIVFVTEVAYFLGGWERKYKAEKKQIKPETVAEEPAKTAIDYSGHLELLSGLFPERYAGSYKVPKYPRRQDVARPDNELSRAICKRLTEYRTDTGKPVSKAILDCVTDLPNRENAVIDAALSAEFGECLMLYFNVLLARGENLLVLCRDEETCGQIADYFRTTLERINLMAQVWMIHSVENAYQNEDSDILVITPHMAMDETLYNANTRFFRHLSTVLMVDTTRLIAGIGGFMTAVANRLVCTTDYPIQYIGLCNGIPAELRVTLEQIFSPGRVFYPHECYSSDDSSRIMIWNYEAVRGTKAPLAQNNLFKDAMNPIYLGVAVPMACAAAKHGVSSISIMGNHLPTAQLLYSLNNRFSNLRQYFGDSLNADELISRIHFNQIVSDNPYIVLLDDSYCLPITIRNYCRYIGCDSAMVHVISKPYMLRDYFAANAGEYLLSHEKAEIFSAVPGDTEKVIATKLISDAASRNGLLEERLIESMRSIKQKDLSIREALETCYSIIMNGEKAPVIENSFYVSAYSGFDPVSNQFTHSRRIFLKDSKLLHRIIGDLNPARVRLHGKDVSLGIDSENIYRYYLPDQAIVLQNRMYYIDSIDEKNGLLFASREIEDLSVPVDYTQHRCYTVPDDQSHMRTARQVTQDITGRGEVQVAESYEANLLRGVSVHVDTLGYMVSHPGCPTLELMNRNQYRELSKAAREETARDLDNASVLALCFKGVDPEIADKLSVTLAVLLSETMKTMFPYSWQCIAVCPVLHSEVTGDNDAVPFDNLALMYPQVKCPAAWIGSEDMAQVLIIEDSARDSGILDTLFRNRQHPLSSLFALLADYLKWQRTYQQQDKLNINADYLKFCADDLPSYLDLKNTEDLMGQLEVTSPGTDAWTDPAANSDFCYFCHKNLQLTDYVILRDEYGKKDRKVCLACKARLLNKKEDLMPLFEQAKAYLCETYGIVLPNKIRVNFVSATKIRKQSSKKKRHFRIIGLAQSLSKTIWVETNSPKENILATLVHELTHIWQYENIRCDDNIIAMEGHTSYMEVLYLHDLGCFQMEKEWDEKLRRRTDEYGTGYVRLSAIMDSRSDKNPFNYMLEQYPRKK